MSAIISPCGQYRYRLERDIQMDGFVVAFFGVNPSTADAHAEDSTTRKWAGFCRVMGARRYIAGNPFAFRSTDVKALASAADPIGPENDANIDAIIADADILIPCWGNRSKVPPGLRHRFDSLAARLFASGKPVKTFGLTASGDPMHPLMLGYSTPILEWSQP